MDETSKAKPEPAEDREDLLPILDEELNRLPHRYRVALVACEIEGKPRREAARQLGIPEGTLSTHLRADGNCSASGCSGAGSASAWGRSRGWPARSSRTRSPSS